MRSKTRVSEQCPIDASKKKFRYKESLACQTLLKKLGFDVVTITKDALFEKNILGFLPDIVIASFKTKNVDGISLGTRAKKLISKPRVLLLYTAHEPEVTPEQKLSFDFLLSSPFEFEQLLRCTAEMARIDVKALLEKYSKRRMRRPQQENNISSSFGKDITNSPDNGVTYPKYTSTMLSEVRQARYKEYLERTKGEEVDKVIDRKTMNMKVAMLEAEMTDDQNLMTSINSQKLEFAKDMFRK